MLTYTRKRTEASRCVKPKSPHPIIITIIIIYHVDLPQRYTLQKIAQSEIAQTNAAADIVRVELSLHQ